MVHLQMLMAGGGVLPIPLARQLGALVRMEVEIVYQGPCHNHIPHNAADTSCVRQAMGLTPHIGRNDGLATLCEVGVGSESAKATMSTVSQD